jgi:hypothetical protein
MVKSLLKVILASINSHVGCRSQLLRHARHGDFTSSLISHTPAGAGAACEGGRTVPLIARARRAPTETCPYWSLTIASCAMKRTRS